MTSAEIGITKLTKINNAGIFSAYSWPDNQPNLSFQKINLVYGCNGSGKTTLSNILGLFSEDYHDRDDVDKERIKQGISADSSKALEIEIEWDGKTAKYPTGKKKLYTFNSAFVTEHVYDGTQDKVKNFKQFTTKEQLSNSALKRIEEEITTEKTHKANVEGYVTKLEKLFSDLKTTTSQSWRENLQGKKTPDLIFEQCPQQAPQESEGALRNALEEEFAKFKAESNPQALEKAIYDLSQIVTSSALPPEDMPDTIAQSIAKTAREKVHAKIDSLKAHALKHSSIQNWFEDGSTLLKQTKENQKCLLCDSALPDIENLIASYDAYFNDELTALMQEISKCITALEELLKESDNKKSQSQRIQTLLAEYGYQDMATDDEKSALSRLEVQEIKELIQFALSLFESKVKSIDFMPDEQQLEQIISLLAAKTTFLTDVALLVSIKDKILARLQAARFNDGNAREFCRKLFWKQFDSQGKSIASEARKAQEKEEAKFEIPEDIGGIALLNFAHKTLQSIQAMLTNKEAEKTTELSKLRMESKYIGEFLNRLCINHLTINIENEGGITVHYLGGKPKKGIYYSLSEGEKTALAFAYFLSKYRHEVLDNPQEKKEDFVIVIDDPISSLDENRLFSTALIIKDMLLPQVTEKEQNDKKQWINKKWDGCKQIIILSHNLIFLKFMSNLIEADQCRDRADLYIEKGVLSHLPGSLVNYQTSYFQKLEKIRDYIDDGIEYENVKDYLPNYIRVVLEAFISFKFARLKGNGKHSLAMLDSLIGTASSDATLFDKYTPVETIKDTQSLKTVLLEIKQKTNPESHGTAQDITHLEYLSKTELKKLAKQTMNVIQFLDQIHYKKAQELKKDVA